MSHPCCDGCASGKKKCGSAPLGAYLPAPATAGLGTVLVLGLALYYFTRR